MAEQSSYNGPAEVWSEGEIRFPEVQVRLGSDTEASEFRTSGRDEPVPVEGRTAWAGEVVGGIPLKDISDITTLEVVELKLPNGEMRQIVFPEPDNLRFNGTGTAPWA